MLASRKSCVHWVTVQQDLFCFVPSTANASAFVAFLVFASVAHFHFAATFLAAPYSKQHLSLRWRAGSALCSRQNHTRTRGCCCNNMRRYSLCTTCLVIFIAAASAIKHCGNSSRNKGGRVCSTEQPRNKVCGWNTSKRFQIHWGPPRVELRQNGRYHLHSNYS